MKKNDSEHRFPVLIAEDNVVVRQLLAKTLTKEGHEVVCVENGREAFELFKSRFFPIILTDWMMPEMNGPDLCRAIREHDSEGYVFIVLLTSKDSQDDIILGLKAGADDYLVKPVNHAELLARLNTGQRILNLERSLKDANEEIKRLSITDPLTGCYNRGYMTKRLPEEIQRARRYRHPLSIIFCDIDHFKAVNDTYGHLGGDLVLNEFVQCLLGSIRHNVDWLARYGGEEFIIVLPETDSKSAFCKAEQLCGTVSQRVINISGQEIHITASFGATGFDPDTPDDKISLETLINRADDHLYQAKQEGRDKVKAGPLL